MADLVREERQRDVVVVSEDESAMRSGSEEHGSDGSRRALSKGTGASSTRASASSLDITSRSGIVGTSSRRMTSSSGSAGASSHNPPSSSGPIGTSSS